MIKNETVISRDGKFKGKTTGGERPCQMEGCNGIRKAVRWQDGELTYPCYKGMEWNPTKKTWKII